MRIEMTNMGMYLKAMRAQRGEASIPDYLKDRGVQISENYYRDLEAGRKVIRVESAKELARQLDLDSRQFFSHLLKDILDEDVFSEVVKPTVVEEMETLKEELHRAKGDAALIQAAFAKQIGSRRTEVSEKAVEALNENFDLLPIVHAVYMRDKISFADVARIAQKNSVLRTSEEIAGFFEEFNLARIDWEEQSFARYTKTFLIPRTEIGQRFKSRFLRYEYEKSAAKNKDSSGDPGTETWSHSTIVISSAEKMRALVEGEASKLVARLNADELKLGDEGAKPFFASVIISPRDDYEP